MLEFQKSNKPCSVFLRQAKFKYGIDEFEFKIHNFPTTFVYLIFCGVPKQFQILVPGVEKKKKFPFKEVLLLIIFLLRLKLFKLLFFLRHRNGCCNDIKLIFIITTVSDAESILSSTPNEAISQILLESSRTCKRALFKKIIRH